jgi:hypothetical protein
MNARFAVSTAQARATFFEPQEALDLKDEGHPAGDRLLCHSRFLTPATRVGAIRPRGKLSTAESGNDAVVIATRGGADGNSHAMKAK